MEFKLNVHKTFYTLIVALLFFKNLLFAGGFPASYYQIDDTTEQKESFIRQMKVMADKGNEEILKDREFVTNFFAKTVPYAFRGLNQQNVGYLINLRNKYGIQNLFDREAYYERIDVIPASLTIAQAALESGWGKSRFAREANNLFGHWNYSGVGLMSKNSAVGPNQMIRIFSSLQKSVNGYMHNLNTHNAYADFRAKRKKARQQGAMYTGLDAAKTMIHYSELKGEYIKMVQDMIRDNNLQGLDFN